MQDGGKKEQQLQLNIAKNLKWKWWLLFTSDCPISPHDYY